MEPLVEVVRDTVGRHDTFGLACTAKYYEDMGYPGHVNCTDNFNEALATRTAIAPRAGWKAINFFYNTGFDAHNLLVVDEPWSRPGDYVLMRRADRPRLRLLGLPRRHRRRQRLEPDRHPRARLSGEEHASRAAIAHRVTPDAEPEADQRDRPSTRARRR